MSIRLPFRCLPFALLVAMTCFSAFAVVPPAPAPVPAPAPASAPDIRALVQMRVLALRGMTDNRDLKARVGRCGLTFNPASAVTPDERRAVVTANACLDALEREIRAAGVGGHAARMQAAQAAEQASNPAQNAQGGRAASPASASGR